MTGTEEIMEGRSRHQEFIRRIYVGNFGKTVEARLSPQSEPVYKAMQLNEDEMSDLLDELLKNYMNEEN